MTNTIACIEKADAILITGSNTTENHPVISSFVKRAVTRRGTRLIVVDPRRITIAKYADKWLRQKLGTDVAWINGLMHVIIKENSQFREASWEEALDLVAEKLGSTKKNHGSDSIGVLTSARITNEENYIAQKFTRAVLQTNNIDHCARL